MIRHTAQSQGAILARAAAGSLPPHTFFLISAVFHYLGPAFAVLLFARIEPLGVAWLRIASAAVIFALWRRPWRLFARLAPSRKAVVIALGCVLAAMNSCFYLAIDRLPLATVGAIEFMGPITLAAWGARTQRNWIALVATAVGVYVLTKVRIEGEPLGYLFAFLNCGLFMFYVVLGHRIAEKGGVAGIDWLGAAMLVAGIAAFPLGIGEAQPALTDPMLLAAAVGVGISSSVIPYVCDQLAMARLPRATFSLLLALLPATATVIGLIVLRQIPTLAELAGIGLVILGVGLHRPEPTGAA